jgi:transposase
MLHLALADYRHLLGQVAEAKAALDRLAAADPATGHHPGGGAEAVAAHLGDPRRFASGKLVSAYAGLVPRQYQSGETDRKGRITRRGPGVLRKLPVECAWAMLRYNAWARATYARLTRGGGTRKKPAVVALARKLLLVRCWAMLRDNADWRADPAPAPTP